MNRGGPRRDSLGKGLVSDALWRAVEPLLRPSPGAAGRVFPTGG